MKIRNGFVSNSSSSSFICVSDVIAVGTDGSKTPVYFEDGEGYNDFELVVNMDDVPEGTKFIRVLGYAQEEFNG